MLIIQIPEPRNLREYLLSINVATVTTISGEMFNSTPGSLMDLHGGHTSTRTKPYRLQTMKGKDPYWHAFASGGKEAIEVKWHKEEHPQPPTAEEIIDALKREVGL